MQATAAEQAALAEAGELRRARHSTLTGHLKEAQFPFAIALAALAIRNGAAYPPFDAGRRERRSTACRRLRWRRRSAIIGSKARRWSRAA